MSISGTICPSGRSHRGYPEDLSQLSSHSWTVCGCWVPQTGARQQGPSSQTTTVLWAFRCFQQWALIPRTEERWSLRAPHRSENTDLFTHPVARLVVSQVSLNLLSTMTSSFLEHSICWANPTEHTVQASGIGAWDSSVAHLQPFPERPEPLRQ